MYAAKGQDLMPHVSFLLYCLGRLCHLPGLITVTSSCLGHKSITFAHIILKLLTKLSSYMHKSLLFTTVKENMVNIIQGGKYLRICI